jgi:hypothetical protein
MLSATSRADPFGQSSTTMIRLLTLFWTKALLNAWAKNSGRRYVGTMTKKSNLSIVIASLPPALCHHLVMAGEAGSDMSHPSKEINCADFP